jgi:hypothetical protein
MKNLSKLISIIIIGAVFLGFTAEAFCMTVEQKDCLINKMHASLRSPGDAKAANILNYTISNLSQEDKLCEAISNAPNGSIDIDTINLLIVKLPVLADDLFGLAKKVGMANIDTYTAYMTVLGNIGNFQAAKNIVQDEILIQGSGLPPAEIYNSYIKAAGNTDNFDCSLIEFFCNLLCVGLANDHTCTAFLDAARKTRHYNEVNIIEGAFENSGDVEDVVEQLLALDEDSVKRDQNQSRKRKRNLGDEMDRVRRSRSGG